MAEGEASGEPTASPTPRPGSLSIDSTSGRAEDDEILAARHALTRMTANSKPMMTTLGGILSFSTDETLPDAFQSLYAYGVHSGPVEDSAHSNTQSLQSPSSALSSASASAPLSLAKKRWLGFVELRDLVAFLMDAMKTYFPVEPGVQPKVVESLSPLSPLSPSISASPRSRSSSGSSSGTTSTSPDGRRLSRNLDLGVDNIVEEDEDQDEGTTPTDTRKRTELQATRSTTPTIREEGSERETHTGEEQTRAATSTIDEEGSENESQASEGEPQEAGHSRRRSRWHLEDHKQIHDLVMSLKTKNDKLKHNPFSLVFFSKRHAFRPVLASDSILEVARRLVGLPRSESSEAEGKRVGFEPRTPHVESVTPDSPAMFRRVRSRAKKPAQRSSSQDVISPRSASPDSSGIDDGLRSPSPAPRAGSVSVGGLRGEKDRSRASSVASSVSSIPSTPRRRRGGTSDSRDRDHGTHRSWHRAVNVVPVIDDEGTLVNVVSAKALIRFLHMVQEFAPPIATWLRRPARGMATTPVICVDSDCPAFWAFRTISDRGVEGLGVLDPQTGLLKHNISASDVRRYLVKPSPDTLKLPVQDFLSIYKEEATNPEEGQSETNGDEAGTDKEQPKPPDAACVSWNATVGEVIALFIEKNISHVFMTRGKSEEGEEGDEGDEGEATGFLALMPRAAEMSLPLRSWERFNAAIGVISVHDILRGLMIDA